MPDPTNHNPQSHAEPCLEALRARLQAGGELTCRDCADFLMAFLDKELQPEIYRTFVEHLGHCPPCRQYLETYRHTIRLAQHACCPKANPDVAKCPPELMKAILAAVRSGS